MNYGEKNDCRLLKPDKVVFLLVKAAHHRIHRLAADQMMVLNEGQCAKLHTEIGIKH